MSAALSRYLKDFTQEALPPVSAFADFVLDDEPEALPILPALDIEAERQAAYQQGFNAARAEGDRAVAEALEAAQARHASEFAEMTRHYEDQMAARIEMGLAQMAERLSLQILDQTAAALAPVFSRTIADKAIADLADAIKAMMIDGRTAGFVVSGPAALYERLLLRMGDKAKGLRHVEAADTDLEVTIDNEVLVTRMSAWAERLEAISK